MSHYWFNAAQNRRQAKLALIASGLALVVILLGAYTRLTNAGLSCPDWPHCYGYLTAPHTTDQIQGATARYPGTPVDVKKAWTEMTHRYFAGTEGLLILVLAFGMLINREKRDTKSALIGMSLIGLLGTQVMLGMLTVTAKLKPIIVVGHLLNGLSLLCILWFAYLIFRNPHRTPSVQANPINKWIWAGFIIAALQVTLGGWVSSHYAGLACIDFPYCNGEVLPSLKLGSLNTDLITIHMLHRIGALITAIYLGALSFALFRHPATRVFSITLVSLLLMQLTLGILNVVWLRPVWLAMLHHTVGILLLLTLIALLVKMAHTRVS